MTFLVEFGVFLAAFGVVFVAPHTGWCVIVAYESRACRRRRHHNHNDVKQRSGKGYCYENSADDVTPERGILLP